MTNIFLAPLSDNAALKIIVNGKFHEVTIVDPNTETPKFLPILIDTFKEGWFRHQKQINKAVKEIKNKYTKERLKENYSEKTLENLKYKLQQLSSNFIQELPLTNANGLEISEIRSHGKKILAEICPAGIKTHTDTTEMWRYNKNLGYWEPKARNFIQTYCGDYDELCKNSAFNSLLTFIQGQTWVERKDFEENEDYINVENGVVEIVTGKLLAHDSKYNFKGRLEIFYDPDAKCPKFMELIENALPERDRLLLQEGFGYTIANIIAKYAFFLQGIPDSGKTTIARILIILLGGASKVSGHSLASLSDRSNRAIAYMNDKKANIDSDMEYEQIKNISTFKKITGGDIITADRKNEHPFQYINRAKLIFVANKFPSLSDKVLTDVAFWNRMIVLMFRKKIYIPEKQLERDINKAIEKNYKPELAGILNWALEGARRYSLNNRFTYDHEATFDMWFEDEIEDNPLLDFLTWACINMDVEGEIPKDEVRKLYKAYCNETGKEELSPKFFGIYMKQLGTFSKRPIIDNKQVPVYKGISLGRKIIIDMRETTPPEPKNNKLIDLGNDYIQIPNSSDVSEIDAR